MDKYAVIVAGGAGTRMGSNLPKQFLLLHDKPVLWYSVNAFRDAFSNIKIILVLPAMYLEMGRTLTDLMPGETAMVVIQGGSSRFQSVKNGLEHVPFNSIVFIHDGVRCLVSPDLIRRCYEMAIVNGNAIPAVNAVDTLRLETKNGNEMIDRKQVRIIQTPQTFLSNTIKDAFKQEDNGTFTDDASVVESFGHKVHLVEGEVTNLKITTPLDLLVAEKIIEKRYPKTEG